MSEPTEGRAGVLPIQAIEKLVADAVRTRPDLSAL